MSYSAPIGDIAHTMRAIAGLNDLIDQGLAGDLDDDVADAILEEAGKFASEQVAPLNQPGDVAGTKFENGTVAMPAGFKDVYLEWVEAGWGGLAGPEEFGGQGLPLTLAMAVSEIWNSACVSFSENPMLTTGVVDALTLHGNDSQKATYLPKLISGEWSGTMQLTESSAGSDLRFLKTKAEPQGDGSYKLSGTKIFITFGEHDMVENIVHMVLARIPGAPAGTKGISLFLVPKILVGEDGSLGERNDIHCISTEHKLGIHASPTCVMQMGDNGGATGWLVGEENRGLNCMFTMMNRARLGVGIQGVGIAERAFQQALAYASERKQGTVAETEKGEMVEIIRHPDVQRMLLDMKAKTAVARTLCYVTAKALDVAERSKDEAERSRALAYAGLLTPVAKAYSTDLSVEVASQGIQVHGGMGYIEETGAAQHLRDARITPIYEGTNGIQAIDLVSRKLPMEGGEVVRGHIAELKEIVAGVRGSNEPSFGETADRLEDAISALEEASDWLLRTMSGNPDAALVGACAYLRLFGIATGGAFLAKGALAEQRNDNGNGRTFTVLARHFADQLSVEAPGLARAVSSGADGVLGQGESLLRVS
jgi:alkylation response protein AidB-like acyl-CoA dehydrogenase